MKGLLHYRGERGELELLLEGTVRREAAERGERIYELSELGELLGEIAAFKTPVECSPARGGGRGVMGPAAQPDAARVSSALSQDPVGVAEISAMVIDKALA